MLLRCHQIAQIGSRSTIELVDGKYTTETGPTALGGEAGVGTS